MHDGGEASMRRLTSSRNLEGNKEAIKMVEPKAKSDSSLFDHGRAASASMFHPIRTHSLPQPYLLQPPTTHHVGAFYHLSPKAAVDPSHYPQTIVALEEELQRAHKELKELKEQLAASETGKAQAWKEFTNIKNLLDQISLVEHFAASDNVEVETTPLPPNWSGDVKEIDRLHTELEAAKNLNSALASELEIAKHEMNEARRRQASLENSRMEQLARLQSEHGSIYVDLDNAKRDISTLQANLSEAWSHHSEKALELARAREEITWLEADAHNLGMELAHAKEDINMLHEDLEVSVSRLRSQYESASSEILQRNQAEVEVRDDEIRRLQGELAESASALEDRESQISTLQSKLEVLKGSSTSLSVATRQIEKLRGELEPLSRLRSQYESTSSEILKRNDALQAELEVREDEIRRLQGELTESARVLEDRESQMRTLQSKLERLRDQQDTSNLEATRQIEKLRGDLETLRVTYERCSSELFHAEKRFEAEHESIVTDIRSENLKLQGVVASLKAENLSLASRRNEIDIDHEATRMQSELIAFHELVMAEVINTREEVINLQLIATKELQHVLSVVRSLKVEMCEVKSDLTTLMLENSLLEQKIKDFMATTSDARLREAMSELVKARDAEESFKTKYRNLATSSEAQIESLKRHMYELRDSEARAKEALVSTSSELQKKKVELEMAKEALEWVGGDAAALSAEVEALRAEMTSIEALRAEITCTKEGETKAKAAFTDYSLKLQKMRLDLENATKLADKARTFKMDLDEVTAKLERALESERAMTASVASLKAELSNARTEMAEKEHELSQMRAQWDVAVMSEATLTDANSALNESLLKVMAEAEEAAFAREQATAEAEKARHEAEQAEERFETLEAKVESLQFEVEAAKATEDWAFAQMRLKTIQEFDMETEEGSETPVSLEEFHSLKAKTKKLEEIVSKRAAVGMAQVNAARASEREMQGRVETLHRELRSCRAELTEAIAKREEAEAAKFSCEAQLRAKRLERKSLSQSGTLDGGGHPMGKLVMVEDRQGSMNSICFEDSQSSSPSRSSKSFASFASPGRSERSPMEHVVHSTRAAEESKQRKQKLASKIGAYFSKNLSIR